MLVINHKPSLKPTVIFSGMSSFTSEKILHCITDVLGCKVSYSSFIQINSEIKWKTTEHIALYNTANSAFYTENLKKKVISEAINEMSAIATGYSIYLIWVYPI